MKKLLILIIIILLVPQVVYGFGYCGSPPSPKQLLTKKDKQKARSVIKITNRDSIKNNCMDCHYMVHLVSKMDKKQQTKWFKGIKYLREVMHTLNHKQQTIKTTPAPHEYN